MLKLEKECLKVFMSLRRLPIILVSLWTPIVCNVLVAYTLNASSFRITVEQKQVMMESPEEVELWALLSNWTCSIEIKYRSNEDDPGILTRVYFPFDPAIKVRIHMIQYVYDFLL